MVNFNLKGLWIPFEILTDKNLSDKEKIILSIVIFLCKENEECFCSNKNLSELLNISITQVSKLINSLDKKGYIELKMIYKSNSKQIQNRKIIPIKEKFNTLFNKTSNEYQRKIQSPIEKKFKDNKYNIKNNKKLNYEQRHYENLDFLYAN